MKNALLVIFFLFSIIDCLQGEELLSPPGKLPVQIETNFQLLKLIALEDKQQTFKADLIFSFMWEDLRLAYASDSAESTKYYLDEAVDGEINKIWHLQVDFLNAISIDYRNKALVIFPNGQVKYFIRVIGEFEYHSDLRKFPFDTQQLPIKIESFLKGSDIFVFVASENNSKKLVRENDLYQEQSITDIATQIEILPGISLQNIEGSVEHSVYAITISVKRNYTFYMYAIIIPLFLLMIIIYPIFFATKEPFLDKLQVCVTSFLVLVATKFVINQDLPHVGYMMLFDKFFFIAYVYITIIVMSVTLYKVYDKEDEDKALKIQHHSRWILPLVLTILLIAAVLLS